MIVRVAVGPARSARSNGEAHVRPLIAKLCHSVTLSRLNISYVDGTPVVQKG